MGIMKLADFDYHLPEELIAQRPSHERDHARMMVLSGKEKTAQDSFFHSLTDFLSKGDVVVINDTKVIPAKLIGRKETGSRIEIMLLEKRNDQGTASQCWEVLLKPGKRIHVGTTIQFGDAGEARIADRISEKKWLAVFTTDRPFATFLECFGQAPLPPYIKRQDPVSQLRDDRSRYQTIYARVPGSVAAPTAGLHFSQSVLDNLRQSGVRIASVTLHVGYGTFMPIETEQIEDHMMEEEFYEIGPEAACDINSASRVIAVGTTSTRVLESAADEEGKIRASSAYSRLYIYPGYRFKRVDGLITNFHLPRSSLYILVCAFAGKNTIECAYRRAVENRYRFYSYGDCMLII
jgi:S-adenosylmethionine:tRNA ribosyltransferase-isomerase